MLNVYENSMNVRMVRILNAGCVPSLSPAPAHGRRSIAGVHQSLRHSMVGTAGSNRSGFSGDLGWKPCLSPTFACQSLEFCEECGLTIWVRKAFGLELKKSLAELLLFHSLTEHMAHLCSPHETILRMCSEEKENKKWYAYARLFVLLSMGLTMSYLCSTANPRRTSFTRGFQSCSKSDCCFRKKPFVHNEHGLRIWLSFEQRLSRKCRLAK